MRRDGWPPRSLFEADIAYAGRIYDALLDGEDHFAVDRTAADRLASLVPGVREAARDNRAFLARTVRFLAYEAGVRQFLDLGSGLPAFPNVHEIVHRKDSLAQVVYCDNDPMVVTHADTLTRDSLTARAMHGDLRFPHNVLGMVGLRNILELDRPLAVLLVAVLHFIRDEENPWAIVDKYKRRMAPGSYLVISHITADGIPASIAKEAAGIYDRASVPAVPRGKQDIERFFEGLDLVAPGLVEVSAWRTLPASLRPALMYAGVGRKPGFAPRRPMGDL
jgi:S-adenosyl methyltransferase